MGAGALSNRKFPEQRAAQNVITWRALAGTAFTPVMQVRGVPQRDAHVDVLQIILPRPAEPKPRSGDGNALAGNGNGQFAHQVAGCQQMLIFPKLHFTEPPATTSRRAPGAGPRSRM